MELTKSLTAGDPGKDPKPSFPTDSLEVIYILNKKNISTEST
jgi:hypothetical protein